jgi:tRNA nucleotidyltransferase (CCA-adding enzyme)
MLAIGPIDRRRREDAAVEFPSRSELLNSLRTLPAARPLLERLVDVPGVYVVGGAVRDLLLGERPLDLDLVVDGDAAAVAERLDGTAVLHDRFGTSTVRLDGFTYDIARTRSETYAAPGALPEVTPAPLVEDLERRDFTVNAIAIALDGAVTALPGALEDLAERRLRVLHDGSFLDDPTRLLRLARYASRLRFEIEPHTLELVRAAVRGGALATISGPRIGAELRLLARESDPVAAFEMLHELELDAAIEPGFGLTAPDLARRALAELPADGRPDLLVLAIATRGVQQPAELFDRLGSEAADRAVIVAAATGAEELAGSLNAAQAPSQIAAAARNATAEQVALAAALGASTPARDWLDRLRHVRLEIDGRDLLSAGVPEGPAVGRGLQAALDAKLDGRIADRDGELQAALQGARD